ncbi:unnamed protein product, partial [Protopolystoma xenopodis]
MPPQNYGTELTATTAGRFFRVDSSQEALQYVTDISSEEIFLLDQDWRLFQSDFECPRNMMGPSVQSGVHLPAEQDDGDVDDIKDAGLFTLLRRTSGGVLGADNDDDEMKEEIVEEKDEKDDDNEGKDKDVSIAENRTRLKSVTKRDEEMESDTVRRLSPAGRAKLLSTKIRHKSYARDELTRSTDEASTAQRVRALPFWSTKELCPGPSLARRRPRLQRA